MPSSRTERGMLMTQFIVSDHVERSGAASTRRSWAASPC
jgi:hypothetical protein